MRFGWGGATHVVVGKKGRRTWRERYANFYLPTLKDADEEWLAWYSWPGEYRRHYIKVFRGEDKARPILGVAQEHEDGSVFVTVLRAKWEYIDRRRVGILLYQRKRAKQKE